MDPLFTCRISTSPRVYQRLAVSWATDYRLTATNYPTPFHPGRRRLWEMLLEAKRHCTMVLTTHSMEEADLLGDRETCLMLNTCLLTY